MNTVLRVGVLLLFLLALLGSAWYTAFRLRTTFGLQRRWLFRVLVMAALAGSFMSMVPAAKSADVVAGLSYVLGGYLFAGYVFLTLAFVLLHVIERAWHVPKARMGAAALLLAAGATLVGAMWANTFSVVEAEIALPGLNRGVVAMQLSDIHLGHHRGRKYLEKHILPVFGKGALNTSPRVGHLHVQVDDLPWWWADPSNVNTIDMAGMPPGPHKIKISLVNANDEVFPGQFKTVTFTIPEVASRSHSHSH